MEKLTQEGKQKLLFDAQEEAVSRCMTARGWRYRPVPWQPPAPEPVAQDPRHGDDVALHRAVGYGVATTATSRSADPNEDYVQRLSNDNRQKYSEALFGTPRHQLDITLPNGEVTFVYTDGCTSRAEQSVYGDLKSWVLADTVVVNLRFEIEDHVRRDPRVVASDRRWSACMAALGYHYRTPDDARRRFTGSGNKPLPTKAVAVRKSEMAQALDDARCDRRVRRARLVRALDRHYSEQVAQQRATQILAYQDLVSRALTKVGRR
ncbi:hypothetical protein [Streptomyces sp. NPDC048191]|uniref:hypothetical protein n=1 Tax=Streptomyces sp. NPDC048191 TaxID=3155484 RepID=UPI0033F61114